MRKFLAYPPLSILRKSLLLGLLTVLAACTHNDGQAVRVEERKTAAGTVYSLFYPQGLAIRLRTDRPQAADATYQLSVAAAYTDLATYQPLDLLVYQGQLRQPKAMVGFLDGVLTSIGDSLTITQIVGGQSPPSAELARVRSQHGTLLLQELLVFQGQNLKHGAGNVFQRRALVELANHHFVVVESAADDLSMAQFGADLVELGARNALYLDMGDWDEGWYKAGSQVVKLGNRRTQTARQSNWLVFARPAATAKPH
jgi:hypothetical protein